MIIQFQVILLYLQFANCEWLQLAQYLTTNKTFNNLDTDGFINIDGDNIGYSQYISCGENGSYIVLNQSQRNVQNNNQFYWSYQMYFITFELIFYNSWKTGDFVNYSFGSNTFKFDSNPISVPQYYDWKCINQKSFQQVLNATVDTKYVSGYHSFNISTSQGNLAIKNLIISGLRCSPYCLTCSGVSADQCLTCVISGSAIPNCQQTECAIATPYIVRNQACFKKCHIDQALYFKRSCVPYPIALFMNLYISQNTTLLQNRWQPIYDRESPGADPLNNIAFENYYIYGIFKHKQGYLSTLNLTDQGTYLIGIRIELILFNAMPDKSSISLQINGTYKAHIYKDGSGLKFDQFMIQNQESKPDFTYSDISYNSNYYYVLYTYVNISNYFIIKLVGNYPASSSAGWGIRSIQISSGQCPQNCQKCDSQFKCSICKQNQWITASGQCSSCSENYQKKINATYCQGLDDQTPYSEYLVKEFIDLSINPETYKYYELLHQQGSNFFKGEGIFYSIWNQKFRIFGGPQIWAQAKFQRIYEINDPHHSVSFAFIIIFGPTFPENGLFIFYLENQIQFEITSTDQEITFEYLYLHTAKTLNVQWECKGPNNEPFNAYCGFYKYYLAVHYCQPGCQSCTNQNVCSTTITPASCLDGKYLDIYKNECKQCSKNCKLCTSLQNCQECLDGYIDPSLGCICDIKKFEDTSGCSDCSQDCNQCINQIFCLECRPGSFKVLVNNECVCQDGYFDDSTVCKNCITNCKKCTNNSDCSECFEGFIKRDPVQCDQDSNFYQSTLLQQMFPCPTNGSCNPCSSNSNCNCGDQIIYDSEQCDDGNQIEHDGCHNCQFSVQVECTMQINGKCHECATLGWYLDQTTFTCKEQCRDGLKVGTEQCDDATDNTNCFNCRFFCKSDCQSCDLTKGVCTKCREGLEIEKNYCKNKCGDGIIVSAPDIDYYEECDDANNQDNDGCSKGCKFQCQNISICKICLNNQCQQCQYGYFLNKIMNKCECGLSCLSCDYSFGKGCTQCQHGYELRNKICYPICGDSYVTSHEQCDDGNMNIEDGCHQCQYTCEQTCELCLFGECLSCYEKYQLQNGRCQLLILPYLNQSEEGIVKVTLSYEEQLNLLKDQYYDFDLFENCTQNNCNTYISYLDLVYLFHRIRVDLQGNEVSENYIEKYEQTCPINCESCFHGLCITCTLGYHLDLDNDTCNPICGDQYITIEELCDDGNNIIQDGCFNCQYQCQEVCTNCQYGRCKACIESYFFDIKKGRCLERTICFESQGYYYDGKQNNCYSKCGDSIKAGKEQCDDGNVTPYDGCFECQYQCELLCQTCQQGRCVDCQIGYKLSMDKCITDCGDGLILGSEQCDDVNTIPRDGCTNCLIDPGFNCITLDKKSYCYTCKSYCNKCEYINGQINCISCQKGYFLASNECIKCSDQCEECLNSPNNCINCKIENCQKCDNKEGFYSDFKLKKCITKCGDMIVAGQEQCDDGNIINNDGCNSQCEFEKGFTCYNNLCQKIQQKYIEFNYSNTTTTNCLHLKGDLDFKSICPKITSEIDLFATYEFNYTLTPFEINKTQSQYGCEIQFQFFKTITETNLIHLIIPLSVDGQRLLDEYRITIIPRKQIYYSQEQKQQAESVVATSNKFQLLLQFTGPISILLGGISFFWTILEILTWINNFYFLNIEYPLNVKIFFQKFQWDDIFYIPDFVSLNTPNDPFYFQPPLKFQEKNVNPLFIKNIQIFSCLISIAIIIYFISIITIKLFKLKLRSNQFLSHKIYIFTKCQLENQQPNTTQNKQSQALNKNVKNLPYFALLIFTTALDYQYNFWSKIQSIINLLLLDIFMACILQLYCPKPNNHYIIVINNFLAVCFLILSLVIYYVYLYVSSKHQLLLNHSIFKKKYLSIYEALNFKNKTALRYCYFNMIRKFAFILFLVVLYDKPIIQTTFCCLSCFMNLAFLFYQNPFNSKSVFIQIGIPEVCIFFIVSLAVVIAFNDLHNILSDAAKQLIGWMIIVLMSLSIAIQMIFLLIEFYHRLKSNFKSLKYLICPQKQQS
ncbi:unnamed protein product (macronuclear) [Paramecium tetraurelia]|uniref:EGF-like domain-containing protein n=1 Tax=Paramecium tetraurelia TaxID=5888 RepID=A0CAA5_PARTE|nr:uncharacterized protein GSPATT00036502001 [Paramecium tetraurelia]CAK67722.1 unnamed protein product [Paramecium tetraurelia]|eukprot:XP_001435119.1 hypothetical protein (macronuclear) [Paramecium tetraurelia strain d4-2]